MRTPADIIFDRSQDFLKKCLVHMTIGTILGAAVLSNGYVKFYAPESLASTRSFVFFVIVYIILMISRGVGEASSSLRKSSWYFSALFIVVCYAGKSGLQISGGGMDDDSGFDPPTPDELATSVFFGASMFQFIMYQAIATLGLFWGFLRRPI